MWRNYIPCNKHVLFTHQLVSGIKRLNRRKVPLNWLVIAYIAEVGVLWVLHLAIFVSIDILFQGNFAILGFRLLWSWVTDNTTTSGSFTKVYAHLLVVTMATRCSYSIDLVQN